LAGGSVISIARSYRGILIPGVEPGLVPRRDQRRVEGIASAKQGAKYGAK
jgi:hypothetical protein